MRWPVAMNRASAVALLAVALAAAAPPQTAWAQSARADSAAVLLETAADLEQRGEDHAAETLYGYIVDRFGGTAAAEAARQWLAEASAEASLGGGETELKVWATTYGIWLGVAVPVSLGAEDSEPYGAGLVTGAPGGFYGARAYSRARPLSLGQARAITWGGTWGALQGMALANALNLGAPERYGSDVSYDDDSSTRAIFATMIAGSAVGIGSGMLAARREIRPGTATSATLGSLWGSWFGLAASVLTDLDEEATWTTMMIGGNAGLVGGALAGSRLPLSRSRARLISVGGLIGGVGGLGIVLLADLDDEDAVMSVALAGSVAGLALGGILTRGHDAERDMSQNAQNGAAGPATGALVNRADGRWSLSAPLPSPSLDPALRGAGRGGVADRGGVAWKVPLLKVRF